jgi:hypothetical protein
MKIHLDKKISSNPVQKCPQRTQTPIFSNRLTADSVCFKSNVTTLLPKYTRKEQLAYDLAEKLFEGIFRKDGVTPYFEHCKDVGNRLKEAGYDEATVAAGVLHDVVEDIEGWTFSKLQNLSGQKTANLVEEVSHKDPNAAWDIKTNNYISHLKTISPEGMAIAACDKTSTLQDDIKALKKEGANAFKKLGGTPEKQLLKHLLIYTTIMTKNPPKEPVATKYAKAINEFSELTRSIIFNPEKISKN